MVTQILDQHTRVDNNQMKKTVVVTGSTSGIGLGIARAFAAEGANVVINGFGDKAEIEAIRKSLEDKGGKALYHAADWAMRLPWIRKKMATPKWRDSHDKWSARIHDRPNQTALLLFASASLGFPPLYVMAVLAGQMRVRLWLFISTCLVGRFIRFVVILGAADWIINLFR